MEDDFEGGGISSNNDDFSQTSVQSFSGFVGTLLDLVVINNDMIRIMFIWITDERIIDSIAWLVYC